MATIEKVDLNVSTVMNMILGCYSEKDPSISAISCNKNLSRQTIANLVEVRPILPDKLRTRLVPPMTTIRSPRIDINGHVTLGSSDLVVDSNQAYQIIPQQESIHTRYYLLGVMSGMLTERHQVMLVTEDCAHFWNVRIAGTDESLMEQTVMMIADPNISRDSKLRGNVVDTCNLIIRSMRDKVAFLG